MATGGRKTQLQVVHQISVALGPNSPANGVVGVVPAGALLLTTHLSVQTAANSTTNTVAVGTTVGGTQLLTATDLKTVAPVAAQGPLAADTPITFTLASTGTAPTTGAAYIAVDYIAAIG